MLRILLSPALDRAGRPSAPKIAVLLALLAPAAWLAARAALHDLGPRPFDEVIHQTGLWAVRLLFVSLAVTPLRQLLRWPKLIQVRRMIGVAAALYASAHLFLYAADQAFDIGRVASEIVLRVYLTIGFTALVGLLLLAATSTDGMLRRLGGKNWRLLHRLVYLIGALAVVHFFMQSKLNVTEPTWMAGLFLWLMGYRLLDARFGAKGRLPLWAVASLAPVAAALTIGGEALYFWLHRGIDPMRVLAANLSLAGGLRPGLIVLAVGAALALAALLRRDRGTTGRRREALATAAG
ncbi:MAG: sulfite oxidase heme-binding subunit YedZ [Alphaproteobacteria bacterium]